MAITTKRQASAAANSVSITIDAGDSVFVFCTSQSGSQPGTPTDSAGNIYTLIAYSAFSGYTALFWCQKALAATSVSFTGSPAQVMLVSTYAPSGTGNIFLGAVNNGGTQSGGTTVGTALTTTKANSKVESFFSFWNSSVPLTMTASAGTLVAQRSSVVAGTIVGLGVIETTTTTTGAYTNTATFGGSNATFQAYWNVELFDFTGLQVSKANVYEVLGAPTGVDVSKANAYEVLDKSVGVNVSKANVYAVLDVTNSNPPVWNAFIGDGVLGSPYLYSWDLAPSSPYSFAYSQVGGTLPPGLSLVWTAGSTAASLSGTPTLAGTFNFTLRATNLFGSADQPFTVHITTPASSAIAPVIWATILQSGKVGTTYSEVISFTYGVAPYTLTVSSGALPPGVTLNNTTKTLQGTPTTPGTYNFNLHVVDNAGNISDQAFTISIAPASQGNSGWAP